MKYNIQNLRHSSLSPWQVRVPEPAQRQEKEAETLHGQTQSTTKLEPFWGEVEEVPSTEGDTYEEGGKPAFGSMEIILVLLNLLALIIGIITGLRLRGSYDHDDPEALYYLEFPGQIFLNMLSMMTVPLLSSSLVTVTSSIGYKVTGKMCLGFAMYIISTTTTAAGVAIVVCYSINPDKNSKSLEGEWTTLRSQSPIVYVMDVISSCIPANLVTATFETTNRGASMRHTYSSNENTTIPILIEQTTPNFLGIMVVSIFLGCVINHLGDDGKPLKKFFHSVHAATMIFVNIFVWYSPVGILFLTASRIVVAKDFLHILEALGNYMALVVGALAFHAVLILPMAYMIVTRASPMKPASSMMNALTIAWATSSSFATLPITMRCLTKGNASEKGVVQLVAPIGASINKNGTAVYEVITCIFIARIIHVDLTIRDIVIVCVTSTVTSIGSPGVPHSSLSTAVIVLASVGIPPDSISIVASVDWFVDRFTTVVNVWGDVIAAGIINDLLVLDIEENISISQETETDATQAISESDGKLSVISEKTEKSVRRSFTSIETFPGEQARPSLVIFPGMPLGDAFPKFSTYSRKPENSF